MKIVICSLAMAAAVFLSAYVSSENCVDHNTNCTETTCATDFHLDCYSHTCTCFRNNTVCTSDHDCENQHAGGCHHGQNHHHWRCSGGRCHCGNEHNH